MSDFRIGDSVLFKNMRDGLWGEIIDTYRDGHGRRYKVQIKNGYKDLAYWFDENEILPVVSLRNLREFLR